MNNYSSKGAILLAYSQGIYFLVTGLWPIVHLTSFMAVTGPKSDHWLVRTIGALIMAIAIPLLIAAVKKEINFSLITMAILSAIGLTIIDIYYVSVKVISPIYLADAIAETLIIIGWILILIFSPKANKHKPSSILH